MTRFDVERARARFPSLALAHDGRRIAYFDGPGGTQVPASVIDAVSAYYHEANANSGGAFVTSERSDAISGAAHLAMADLFGSTDPDEITFGANMTSLTFHVSRSIAATWRDGDEIVVTGLDHQANVDPWLAAAADRGIRVRRWEPRLDDCTLHLDDLDPLLSERTRLVAIGWASNAVGTINPVADVAARARAVGAWTYVDAVAFAPHVAMDVAAIAADFVVVSAYKFFGPHAGILWGRREVLERLPAYKVRPAHHRFETGTQNFEGQAGTLAAVEYLASLGRSDAAADAPRRRAVVAAMAAVREHEMDLYRRLADGLEAIDGVRLYGITDRRAFDQRTPTAALTVDGLAPRQIAEALGRQGIAVWDGDFYATGLIERLGRANDGGVLRVGLMHYNTDAEVDRLLAALAEIAATRALAAPA
jgi:cysteine desulfurase family protein (TIGR01976 family)